MRSFADLARPSSGRGLHAEPRLCQLLSLLWHGCRGRRRYEYARRDVADPSLTGTLTCWKERSDGCFVLQEWLLICVLALSGYGCTCAVDAVERGAIASHRTGACVRDPGPAAGGQARTAAETGRIALRCALCFCDTSRHSQARRTTQSDPSTYRYTRSTALPAS